MQFPSWSDFSLKVTEFEQEVLKFLGWRAVVEGIQGTPEHPSLKLLPDIFCVIAETIMKERFYDDAEKYMSVIKFLRHIREEGENNYNQLTSKLNYIIRNITDINIITNNERRFQLLKEILDPGHGWGQDDHDRSLRIEILKQELAGSPAKIKILPDVPVSNGLLSFSKFSKLLAKIIKSSVPQFTVGVFGGWGTGKTTLMLMIDEELKKDGMGKKVLTVRCVEI